MESTAGARLISDVEKVVVPEPEDKEKKNILILRRDFKRNINNFFFFFFISLSLKFHLPIQG